jgi:murein DD-endopeptidase MepM/ murein hydrolase activator NlpD
MISVTGTLDGQSLFFATRPGGAWGLAGLPVAAEPGAHLIGASVEDGLGASVSVSIPVTVKPVEFGSEHIDIPAERQGLLDPGVQVAESEELHLVFARLTPEKLWEGLFVWPHAGEISSPFGLSRAYNGIHASYHGGVDITGNPGAPVIAANSGQVALAAPLLVRGNAVILDHGCGVLSAYYHLSEFLVQEGQWVTKGELIGRVGDTGLSTGAHLHWEMRVGDILVDPVEWTTTRIPEWQ